MPRLPAEIDAARRKDQQQILASEVRAYPPGYVEGGKLKLNTLLQIEVSPIAINIAGRDVRVSQTIIINEEHWKLNGVTMPRVPGCWYYLYLNTSGIYAVSANEPVYNTQYYGYYHPIVTNHRAIGKFYVLSDSHVGYVQTSLETASGEVLVAASTYKGTDADYYCAGTADNILIQTGINYLTEAFSNRCLKLSQGAFYFPSSTVYAATSSFGIVGDPGGTRLNGELQAIGTSTAYLQNIAIKDLILSPGSCALYYIKYSIFDNIYGASASSFATFFVDDNIFNNIKIRDSGNALNISGSRNVVSNIQLTDISGQGMDINYDDNLLTNILCKNIKYYGIYCPGDRNILNGIRIENCAQTHQGLYLSGYYRGLSIAIGASQNIISNILSRNNGNLIDRLDCGNSSTSPMIFDEAAPTASNCTWGFTTDSPYTAPGCYRFSKTAAAGTLAYLHLVDNIGAADTHGLVPGIQYDWSGYFKVNASSSCGYQGIRIYQATTGGGAASSVVWTTATIGWQQVNVTATIYANATTAYISFVASASLGNTHYFDVDNLRLFPPGTNNVHNQNYYDGGTNTYDGL